MADSSPGEIPGAGTSPSGGTSSLQTGSILAGRYRIVQRLGDGAMGTVYLGEHIKIGRKDAIKVLKDSLAADKEAMARFVRGARSVSRILHPNVCTIYDFSDTAEGVQYLAMEYIPGETLRDLLTREGTLPLHRVVSITAQAAGALQAAHEAGIVHRDLKPANIMLMAGRDGSAIVKVVDFDIAKAEDDGGEGEVTRFGFVVGTPEYMSPEQLTGEPLDGRSDVYSLALVVYRMLTGLLPFPVENTREMLIGRLTMTPKPLEQSLPGRAFPPAVQQALDWALQREAANRAPSTVAFAEALARAAGVESAAAMPPRVSGRPSPAPAPAEVPATQITDALAGPGGPQRVAVSPKRKSSSRLIFGSAAAAITLLIVVVAWSISQNGSALQPDANNNAGSRPDSQTIDRFPGPVGTIDSSNQKPAPGGNTLPVTTPTNSAGASTTPTSSGSGNPTSGTPATPSGIQLGANLDAILDQQIELLADPGASARVLEAVADTAEAIFNKSTSAVDQREAALLAGNALLRVGNIDQGRIWARRALDLCKQAFPEPLTQAERCKRFEMVVNASRGR